MGALKDRILKDGKCFPGGILKVDSFINHQMDATLMRSMAVEFVRRFASARINKIITVEARGNAAMGNLDLVKQAGAALEGMGFLIEKSFQNGGNELRRMGIHVESLAIIDSLDNCTIQLRD